MGPTRQPALRASANAVDVLLEATRRLFWLESPAQARRLTCEVVTALGGSVVEADQADANAIPFDVSFGDGKPLLPVAPRATPARQLLEERLPSFVLDVRRALELATQVDRFAEDASIDVLTRLANRRMVGRALGRLKAGDVVIMMDLDHFKKVNDTYGHKAGDSVLTIFGHAIISNIRENDFAGRYGGEEFVIILRGAHNPDAFLARLRQTWEDARPRPTTFSGGIALVGEDPALALPAADHALYRAKKAGRDQWLWARTSDYEAKDDAVAPSASDKSVANFVAFNQLHVPLEGQEQIELAFQQRLSAVEAWPGFCSLEVWADNADETRYAMVSSWTSIEAFRAYMKSDDHQQSHDRILTGEGRPRAREFRRFRIASR